MPRRYYRRYRRAKRKYSVEQRPLHFNLSGTATTAVVVVPPTTTEGMRKAKNFTVSLVPQGDDLATPVWWALVYVPEGTQAGSLNFTNTTASLYEPNQFVINCGISDPTAGPIRFFTPLSRNLNSGDAIYMLVGNPSASTPAVQGTARYAIAY